MATVDLSELRRLDREVQDGPPEKRLEDARLGSLAARELQDLRANQALKVTGEFNAWLASISGRPGSASESPTFDGTARSLARRWRFAALLLIAFEMLFGGSQARLWLNLPEPWPAVVGVGLAVVLSLAVEALMLLAFRRTAPNLSQDRLKRIAAILTGVLVLVMGLGGIMRMNDELPPWLFGAVTAMMSLMLPLTAGAYLALAFILDTGNRLYERWANLDLTIRETRILLLQFERRQHENEALLSASGAPALSASPTAGLGSVAGWLIGILLWPLFFLLMPGATAPARAEEPGGCPVVLEVRVDISGSLEPEVTRWALLVLGRQVSALATGCDGRLRVVKIYQWATATEASFGQPLVEVDLPVRMAEICPPLVLTETERLYKVLAEKKTTEYHTRCQQLEQLAASRFAQELEAPLKRVTEVLAQLRIDQPRKQTCVFQAVAAAARRTSENLIVLVTDGVQEACAIPPEQPKPKGARVLMVLVPGRESSDTAVEELAARGQRYKLFLPGLTVRLASEIDGLHTWLLPN